MKGILRLEIEKLQCGLVDERSIENRSANGDLGVHPIVSDTTFTKCPSYRSVGQKNANLDVHSSDEIDLDRNGDVSHGLGDNDPNDVSISGLVDWHVVYMLEEYSWWRSGYAIHLFIL